MGLCVGVGLLADVLQNDDPEETDDIEQEFALINQALRDEELPEHEEPRRLPELKDRSRCLSYPYSYLHHLRRLAAHHLADPSAPLTPAQEDEDPAEDPKVEKEYGLFRSHLICHSDSEGFYVPIDFEEVILAEEIRGEFVGSSVRLMEELKALAAPLGIQLKDGHLSDAEAQRVNDEAGAESSRFSIELTVWLSLYEACRLSLEHKAAVYFS